VSLWSSQFPDVRILKSQYPVVVPVRQASKPKRGGQPFLIHWSAKRPETWTSLSSISPLAAGAVVVSEDWAFFSHRGYDSNQIREALKHDLEQGSFARGASTITQQVAKNIFLTQEKSLWRKAKELLLAIRMDRELGKRKVLETYLNVVEWGPGVFGIHSASTYYFGKPPSALTAREGAFLAMLLPSPVRYSQSFRQKKLTGYARSTVSRILEKMSRAGYLTPEEADEARRERMPFELSEPDGNPADDEGGDEGAEASADSQSDDAPEVEESPASADSPASDAGSTDKPTEEIDQQGGAEDT
jgi:monofunctional biosynthetic peptidoglycan transglycosylase